MRRAPDPPLARLGIAAAAFVLWSGFAAWHAHQQAADFYVFWTAGAHAAAPYDPAIIAQLQTTYHIDGALPFVYPPTFLLLAWPLAQLPLALAFPLWTGLGAALFFYAASHLIRPAWATLGLFIAPPVVLAIAPGQTSLLVGACAIAGWLSLERRPALAGLLFALAACIKPQAMLLAPIVLWGHWRALRWMVIGGAALVLASFAFGPQLWPQWLQALADFGNVAPGTNRINPSALAAGPLAAGACALLGLWLALRYRDLAGLIVGGLCLTPYAHQYDLAPLAPIAAAWLLDYKRQGWALAAAGAALLAGLVASPLAGLLFAAGLALAKAPWPRTKPQPDALPAAPTP
jgi:hypothetical protein